MPRSNRPLLSCAALATGAVLLACSDPREDVRLTLCKDMVAVELGAAPSWQGSEVQIRGYQGATLRVRFATEDGGVGQAACEYEYDAVDDTALTLVNPIEAYSTSPAKMTLDGRTLVGPELARAVKRAMQKQGRDFVDRARETLRGQ